MESKNVKPVKKIMKWLLGDGQGNGTPLQYSCLENPTEGGAWWATVHGVAKGSDTSEQLNDNDKRVWHS